MNQQSCEQAFDLTITCNVGSEYGSYLDANLRAVAALLPRRPATLSVAIVDDAAMTALHERFLGIAGPTDVLTFELEHDESGHVAEGEVVICLNEAERQAEGSRETRDELLLYAVHGLLHLSGFDDRTDEGHAAMHAKEDELLVAIGVGPVFKC